MCLLEIVTLRRQRQTESSGLSVCRPRLITRALILVRDPGKARFGLGGTHRGGLMVKSTCSYGRFEVRSQHLGVVSHNSL